MRNHSSVELDRLFARYQQRVPRTAVPEAWSPPWQPRGKWWMRDAGPRLWRASAAASVRVWHRLLRPTRRG